MNPLLAYFAAYPVQANFYRRTADHPVADLAAAMAASARGGIALAPHVVDDHGDAADPAWWRAQLATSPDPLRRDYGGVLLSTRTEPIVNARYNRELVGVRLVHARLRVDLPADAVAGDRAALATWFAAVAEAYRAETAWVHTNDLLAAVRDLRLPDDEMRSPWLDELDPPTRARFAAFPPAPARDACDVPEAVWWMNVWSAATVAALGDATVAGAGWHRRERLGSGAWLLVATDAPPDRDHPVEIARVAELADALGLAAAQR